MSLRGLFWWNHVSTGVKRTKNSRTAAAASWAGRCRLRLEHLEDRRLLSVGLGPVVSSATIPHSLTSGASAAAVAAPADTAQAVETGPTINDVVVSDARGLITWNVTAAAGVAGSTLSIDGAPVSKIAGPYEAAAGMNYSWSCAALPVGKHTYVITATDIDCQTAQQTGTFVLGPAISMVVASEAQGMITWNAAAARGVTSSKLSIDGTVMGNVAGPYTAPPGLNYGWAYGVISSGIHGFTITATDTAGKESEYTGTFTVGPTISMVVPSAVQGVLTWNAAASVGISTASLVVDGWVRPNISGPYTAPPGVNYAWSYGSLSSGNHSFTISATDATGRWAESKGTFYVPGPAISMVTVSAAQGVITWNAASGCGVSESSIVVDDIVRKSSGPWEAPPGLNYSWAFDGMAVGAHTYWITATDRAGATTQYMGSFVLGPIISKVTVSATELLLTWNVAAELGPAGSTLVVDGDSVSNLSGPWPVSVGVNYAWPFGGLSHGSHSFTITATDGVGSQSQYNGTFLITS